MKDDKDIGQKLNDHEKRISYLESLLLKSKATKHVTDKRKLSDHIVIIRDKGFFAQPKTAEETQKKLQESYHCELNRVAVALLRLSKRKLLRRASKVVEKKSYQAYVW